VLDATGLRAFYNHCQVFVLPSDYEGWGLPAAEAMASGAALVTTANGGAEDFAIDGTNALVVPRRDPGAIAKSVLRLLEDDALRLRLARSGLSDSAGWTLTRAAETLEKALLANVS
jgi:glycosyltransferase involved in cell wall biosynthesis